MSSRHAVFSELEQVHDPLPQAGEDVALLHRLSLSHNIVGSGKELKSVINNASTDIPSSGIKVAYQGIKGANGHEATLRLFPNGEAVNYKSFADVFSAVDNGEVAFGVLPVENSSAGSVSAVYDLIL